MDTTLEKSSDGPEPSRSDPERFETAITAQLSRLFLWPRATATQPPRDPVLCPPLLILRTWHDVSGSRGSPHYACTFHNSADQTYPSQSRTSNTDRPRSASVDVRDVGRIHACGPPSSSALFCPLRSVTPGRLRTGADSSCHGRHHKPCIVRPLDTRPWYEPRAVPPGRLSWVHRWVHNRRNRFPERRPPKKQVGACRWHQDRHGQRAGDPDIRLST